MPTYSYVKIKITNKISIKKGKRPRFVIEAEVHNSLRTFLRSSGAPLWPHHLTLARFVARALRLGRNTLLQTGIPSTSSHGRYRLSYLMPLLMWPEPVLLVAPEVVLQRLLRVEIPQLQQWLQISKVILSGSCWPKDDFQGLFLTTPEAWLADRLLAGGAFPPGIPTVIDGVDELEDWVHQQFTACLQPADWYELMQVYPDAIETIRDVRVFLTRAIFQHPANRYECYALEAAEQEELKRIFTLLINPENQSIPIAWERFWQRWQVNTPLVWAEVTRSQGLFSLYCSPVEVSSQLRKIWQQQPLVLIAGTVDFEAEAATYRSRLGLGDMTSVRLSPARHHDTIDLYLPQGLPLPNTPQFEGALLREFRRLLSVYASGKGLMVLLVGDVPLKSRIGSLLAAEFGSRVQVEKLCLDENSILVTGWEFWLEQYRFLPSPQLLAIATLPIPSLEHPLVAARVAYYKQQRQDWFRSYLLPVALSQLHAAIAPIRERSGVVALLDSRIHHRSYGHQLLSSLRPLARSLTLNSLPFFHPTNYSLLD